MRGKKHLKDANSELDRNVRKIKQKFYKAAMIKMLREQVQTRSQWLKKRKAQQIENLRKETEDKKNQL